MPRAWAPTNNVYVDAKDNVWVMDRCEAKGCLGSEEKPIWQLSSDGKVMKNFGAGMFAFPHTVKPEPGRQHLGHRRGRQRRQGQSGLQILARRQGADDAGQEG